MRLRPTLLLCILIALAVAILWLATTRGHENPAASAQPASSAPAAAPAEDRSAIAPTEIYAHNLLLRQGPDLKVYIPWVRGQMIRTRASVPPSLDNTGSFIMQVHRGVVRVQLSDLSRFLNSGSVPNAPFTHVSFAQRRGSLVMHATVHRLVPLPVEVSGNLSAENGNLVAFHVARISVLKLPLHGLLSGLHLKLSDVFQSHAPGIRVAGNTILFNADILPPAPHLRGRITAVHLVHDNRGLAIEAIYGGAHDDPTNEQRWRDFLQLTGGTLSFGKLSMQHVDLILIDEASKDPWFDLDLAHYQTQLVHGIIRVTPQAGMQIYMPSLGQLPNAEPSATITQEWLKDRDMTAPASVPTH